MVGELFFIDRKRERHGEKRDKESERGRERSEEENDRGSETWGGGMLSYQPPLMLMDEIQ